jgi:4-amino-4-deoxy-L-arabinose transferase-like glycosyltransferase
MPLVVMALALLHLAIGASIGLSVDEAHYLLYAAHPDWSYFDHPPLVGWIQWPLVALDAPVWLTRTLPGALWLLSAWGIFHVTVRLQPAQRDAGLWALAAFALAPVIHVLGIGLVPDTLLMALSIWTMALTLHMVRQPALAGWRWWLLLGLALGLAGLSKYTAVLLAVPVMLCLLMRYGAGLGGAAIGAAGGRTGVLVERAA